MIHGYTSTKYANLCFFHHPCPTLTQMALLEVYMVLTRAIYKSYSSNNHNDNFFKQKIVSPKKSADMNTMMGGFLIFNPLNGLV